MISLLHWSKSMELVKRKNYKKLKKEIMLKNKRAMAKM